MIRNVVILLIAYTLFLIPWTVYGADLTHTWKSPSFSGNGYSAHVLTIENQEYSRKKAIKEKKEANNNPLNNVPFLAISFAPSQPPLHSLLCNPSSSAISKCQSIHQSPSNINSYWR